VKIILLRAWPDRHECTELSLPEGSRLSDALAAAGWPIEEGAQYGVWGKVQPLDRVLRDQDRVEAYRPLVADPKTARRRRALR
jgi:uncharacterized protein